MSNETNNATQVLYRNQKVDGVDIFYREAGSPQRPKIVLLHGYPSSSHMFRELIPRLAEKYHVIAADMPGFGYSDAPAKGQFAYNFEHLLR
jgi:pimeloyl-ACP methyl ester carboxylesterase